MVVVESLELMRTPVTSLAVYIGVDDGDGDGDGEGYGDIGDVTSVTSDT